MALKRQEKVRVATLRRLLSEIKNFEIAEHKPADDARVAQIVKRGVKQHRESIEMFKVGGRDDLVANEEREMEILKEFLPEQMSHEEIVAEVQRAIELVGAGGPGDKGKVMSQLMPQLRGKADGKDVADTVSQLLSEVQG